MLLLLLLLPLLLLLHHAQAYFNENPESDKLGKLREDIGGVRDVMVSNIGTVGGVGQGPVVVCLCLPRGCACLAPCVTTTPRHATVCVATTMRTLRITEKILERGEKIELLVDKTDALNQSAAKFQKQVGTRVPPGPLDVFGFCC